MRPRKPKLHRRNSNKTRDEKNPFGHAVLPSFSSPPIHFTLSTACQQIPITLSVHLLSSLFILSRPPNVDFHLDLFIFLLVFRTWIDPQVSSRLYFWCLFCVSIPLCSCISSSCGFGFFGSSFLPSLSLCVLSHPSCIHTDAYAHPATSTTIEEENQKAYAVVGRMDEPYIQLRKGRMDD
jgi:hypothetical protein